MSLSKNEIKFIRSMQQKKFRDSEGLFVVEGVKMVNELLHQDQYVIKNLFYTADCTVKFSNSINSALISNADLERISGFKQPNQILALVEMGKTPSLTYQKDNLILMLDDVKDPGNLGTIIRTAEWFGVEQIICSTNTVDHFNPKVIQASMGSIFRVKLIYADLIDVADDLKENGYDLLGADMQGENAFTFDYQQRTALIMGSESHGISSGLVHKVKKITIPKFGKAESLNVGMAAGIILANYKKSLSF